MGVLQGPASTTMMFSAASANTLKGLDARSVHGLDRARSADATGRTNESQTRPVQCLLRTRAAAAFTSAR